MILRDVSTISQTCGSLYPADRGFLEATLNGRNKLEVLMSLKHQY